MQQRLGDGTDVSPRYQALRKLGSGGGGEVWEVRCRLTGVRLALKVMSGHAGPREADALVREVVTLSALEGLGLPHILRLGQLSDGRLYVVRELVDGTSLDELAGQDPQKAMALLVDAAEQLTIVHRSGVLHGDIKPANIIARTDGSVTLVDFGLAAPWREGGVTPEGLTPRYAAPELLRGGALTVRAEVFSLGAILAELLESAGAADRSDFRALRSELARVAQVATNYEPIQRFPSADEFAAELRRTLGAAAITVQRRTAFAWPIRGIESTFAKLLGLAQSMPAGQWLRIDGESGAGRSVLLHRLAFSLGSKGTSLVLLDGLSTASKEMALLELDALTESSQGYCLIDDADQLSFEGAERLRQLQAEGARVITVGALEGFEPHATLTIPSLDPDTIAELVRGAIPSAPADVIAKLAELSRGLPGRLRSLITRVAGEPLACAADLDRIVDDDKDSALLRLTPLGRILHWLERGRLRDARNVLEENRDSSESQSIEWVVAEARLLLGLGESARARALLQLVLEQNAFESQSPQLYAIRAYLARAHVGQGDYTAAVALAEQVPWDSSATAIEAHTQRALALAYLGRRDEAHRLLAALSEAAERSTLPRMMALVGVTKGLLAQREDRHEDALADYRRALEFGERGEDAGLLATTQLNLAGLLKVRGDLAGADEHFEAALDLGQRTGRVSTVRIALLNLANLDLYLGRLGRARTRIDALASERQNLPAIVEAQLRSREAEYYAQSGQIELAVENYGVAARAFETLKRNIEAVDALLEGVLVASRAPQPDVSALRVRLEHARELLGDSTAHRTMLALAAGRVAAVAGEEGHARTAIDQAISDARTNQHKEWLWRALEARAELEEQTGRRLRARRDREEALGVLEEIGAELPRDLREVYWNNPRRAALRAEVVTGTGEGSQGEPLFGTPRGNQVTLGRREALASDSQARDVSTMLSTPLEMRLAKILEINSELAGELSLERLTERVTGHAVRLVRAERGLVLLRDESGKLSVYCAKETGTAEHHLRFSQTVAETVMNTGEPVVSVNVRDDQRMSGWGSVHELMLQSVACVPIRDRHRQALGALYLETRMSRGSGFALELPMLQAFADQVAIAIQNARLITENQQRALELEESNQKLVEAQAKLEEILGNRTAQLERTRRKLRETRDTLLGHFGYHGLVGTSSAMRRVYALVERVKDTDVPVLITGESGTGKEMVARAIHEASSRAKRRFVGVNCGAIPENLLESELFGCVRGAFTGAERDRKGLIRESEGGTILLDEIGEMPQKMQAGLLRVLQERKLRPVGGTQEESVDVRLVFATHRDLQALVEERRFREDLYYRIHVVEVRIPPLRERTEDIPQLVDHFLGIFAARHRRDRRSVTRDALRLLMAQPWRGNVRELEHVLLNVWVMTDAEELDVGDFEVVLGQRTPSQTPSRVSRPEVTSEFDEGQRRVSRRGAENERDRIMRALKECGQNRVKAAQLLGIPRRTFYRRLDEYEIE